MFRMAVGHGDEIDAEDTLEAVFRECDEARAGRARKAGLLLRVAHSDLVPSNSLNLVWLVAHGDFWRDLGRVHRYAVAHSDF